MRYLKIAWDHSHRNELVTLYSECDGEGWEIRKVEVFRDGRFGYASRHEEILGSRLGAEPIPTLHEIAEQSEFHGSEISAQEFETVWSAARSSHELQALSPIS